LPKEKIMMKRAIIDSYKELFIKNTEWFTESVSAYYKPHFFETIDPRGEEISIDVKKYFHQVPEWTETSIENDLIASKLWQDILKEVIVYRIQESPHCFGDRNEDNDVLVKSYIECVPGGHIKSAYFKGGGHGADGAIVFHEPCIKKTTHFPLEVGYCTSDQFLYHLLTSHCIARLPYGCDHIIYFETLEDYNCL